MKPSNSTHDSAIANPQGGRKYLLLKLADFSKQHVAVFAVLFGAIGGVWLLNSSSAGHPTPSVYLTPDTQTLTPGSTFTVQIREDSGAVAVNAVAVRLNYPSNLLECTDHPDGAGSAFDIDIEQQRFKGNERRWAQTSCPAGQGKVIINRGTVDGVSGDRLVASVTFKVKAAAGTADLTFADGTELNDATTSADILGSLSATVGGHYQIGNGGSTTPSPAATGRPTPAIYLAPDSQSLAPGATFAVQVHEDSGTTPVNAVAVVLNYPADLLDCVGHPDGKDSAFDFDIEQQRFSNSNELWNRYSCPPGQGKVVFNRGMIDGVTGDKLVATVTFRVKAKTGTANLTFGEGTQLNSAETSEDILGSLSAALGGRYPIGTGDMRGDLNKDGKVDSADLTILLLHWQTNDAISDIDHSGTVDVTDMSILLSGYNTLPITPTQDDDQDKARQHGPSINLSELLARFIKGLVNSGDIIKQLNAGSSGGIEYKNNNICSNVDVQSDDLSDLSSLSNVCGDSGSSSKASSKSSDSGSSDSSGSSNTDALGDN